MRPSSPSFNCITLTLLLLPAIVLAIYFLTSFPHVPQSVVIHSSLAGLVDSPSRSGTGSVADRIAVVYSENYWTVDEDEKRNSGYVSLPQGRMRYWIIGPADGTKLVLIHGLSVPSVIWKDVAPGLAQSGYRVLLYDLYGRGYSDAPQLTYSTSLYVTQLALLMQYVGWERANIAAISMGGGVAAAFSVQFPHLVTGKIALLATAGILEAADMSRTSRFLSSPLMQLVTSSYPFRMYLKHLTNASNSSHEHEDSFSELIRIQSAHLPGYNLALASSIRDGPTRNLSPVFVQLGRQTKKRRKEGGKGEGKLLLVWGTKDKVVPYHYASRVLALLGGDPSWHTVFSPVEDLLSSVDRSQYLLSLQAKIDDTRFKDEEHVELITITGAEHDLTASHPELITRLLIDFFEEPC